MKMHDSERQVPMLLHERHDDIRYTRLARTGIHQQCPIAAEEQKQKRLFVMRRTRLPQDVRIRAVLMHDPLIGDPRGRQSSGLQLSRKHRGEQQKCYGQYESAFIGVHRWPDHEDLGVA